MSNTLSRSKRERGLSLETLQHKRASSSLQGRLSWFAWSSGRKLRVTLELRFNLGDPFVSPQGSQISFGVERGTSGFFAHRCRDE